MEAFTNDEDREYRSINEQNSKINARRRLLQKIGPTNEEEKAQKEWADKLGDKVCERDTYVKKSMHFMPPNTTTRAASSTIAYVLESIVRSLGLCL